jgi:KUP system potassium uptake protein
VPLFVAEACRQLNLEVTPEMIVYIIGRETIVPSGGGLMSEWTESLFAFMSRNAEPATRWFRLPPRQVIEVGSQYDL